MRDVTALSNKRYYVSNLLMQHTACCLLRIDIYTITKPTTKKTPLLTQTDSFFCHYRFVSSQESLPFNGYLYQYIHNPINATQSEGPKGQRALKNAGCKYAFIMRKNGGANITHPSVGLWEPTDPRFYTI